MTAQRKPRLGEPYPGRPNSLLVHIPTWADMVDFGQGKAQMENGYPRSVVHPDIRLLSSAVRALIPDVHCTQYSVMLLSGSQAAISCKQYILSLSHLRDQSNFTNSIQIYSVEFMTSLCRDHHSSGPVLYAVIYPSELSQDFSDFWQRAGPGASSRLAQQCLKYGLSPRIRAWTPGPENAMQRSSEDLHPVYQQIRSRISGFFQRSTDNPQITRQVSPSDVFLYGSGMAAIYHVHQSLLKWRSGESISTGLLYEPTYRILQSYGPGLRAYKLGTDGDLDDLAAYLEAGPEDCPTVQAIWCECPSNPLLRTVDLQRLRQLANQHEILVVVDDSIASFANVNLLDVADIIVSSLSKYFSGYADVMAGSVVLNPNSKQYGAMRRQLASTYENGLFVEDAIQLELNGRDFLARIARINNTTQYLVTKLLPLLSNPSSPLTRIYHPSLCHSRAYYDRQMCSKSEEFEPGYGGVFTMEFIDIASSAIFFDHLDVYKGLSFGADVCIASPYMQMTGQAGKKQGATNDTNETIIRFSVGLEEAADILQIISTALDAADSVHMPKCQASL